MTYARPYFAHIKSKKARLGLRMDAVLTHIRHALPLVKEPQAARALETALDFLRDAIAEKPSAPSSKSKKGKGRP